jgi:hypothetical protein
MKQKLFIFLSLILLIAVLVGLNAASYVERKQMPDREVSPNRSTFNAGATGTRAFYDLLHETGRKVVRWQESPSALLPKKSDGPAVFVVIGEIRREFENAEAEDLFKWVQAGGRLVIVDREPPKGLIATYANWTVVFQPKNWNEIFRVDPTDQRQMTSETQAVKPVQPTLLTAGVNAIQPSRFASDILMHRIEEGKKTAGTGIGSGLAPPPPAPAKGNPARSNDDDDNDDEYEPAPFPTSQTAIKKAVDDISPIASAAPIAHFGSGENGMVVSMPYGAGRIVYVADPYIFSNGGIGLADNAQLAINTVAAGKGLIAFDEFHQGYGQDRNRFLQFFEGTPVIAIFLQLILLVGFVFFSKSRRFARAVPEPEPDRLSKLEYVSAMAELQERTRAYDLAIENVYSDFRRRASRSLGLDNLSATYTELARAIAERTGDDNREVSSLLFKCEEIIRGEPTNKSETLELTASLRRLEAKLGISRAEKGRGPRNAR